MDELLGRSVPYSMEAEQSVIGSMIIDSRCVPEVVEILKAEDFYIDQNRDIFETIHSMFSFSQAIDPVTVLDRMKIRGVYDDRVSRDYIMQLMEITPTAANVGHYAKIVRDKAVLRQIAQVAGEVSGLVYNEEGEASEILEVAEQKIYAIRQGRADQGFAHISTVLIDVYENLNELAKNKGKIPGLTTGFSELDNMISGLNKTDLVLVASRPGMGKTSIALNMALAAAKKERKPIAIFSLEMSKEQLAARLLAAEAFVDSKKLLTGDLNENDWTKIAIASESLSRCDIRIDDNPTVTPAEIKAKCRRVDGLGLVIIDYLQLMQLSGRRNENRVQEVSEISRSLKIMAKELSVPVLCLSQLSRANEKRTDKRPMLSDLRESGAIEQDADIIMFLYREDYYDEDTDRRNIAECIVAKNRHGSTGTIELQWVPQYTVFASRERIHTEEY
ncbi:MAG: replicative DNA helicase [Clostridiales bacterium]|jgi:replicative DNA helicase|nr:replicative DNA helicase [Clostridiales bacterium]